MIKALTLAALLALTAGSTLAEPTRVMVRGQALDAKFIGDHMGGIEVTLTFDESYFEGTSVYGLGAVLERFFRKYVMINSFTETVLHTTQRGEIARRIDADGVAWRVLPLGARLCLPAEASPCAASAACP